MDDFTLLATKAALLRARTKEASLPAYLLGMGGLFGGGLLASKLFKSDAPAPPAAPEQPAPAAGGPAPFPTSEAASPSLFKRPTWRDRLRTGQYQLRHMVLDPLQGLAGKLASKFHRTFAGGPTPAGGPPQ